MLGEKVMLGFSFGLALFTWVFVRSPGLVDWCDVTVSGCIERAVLQRLPLARAGYVG